MNKRSVWHRTSVCQGHVLASQPFFSLGGHPSIHYYNILKNEQHPEDRQDKLQQELKYNVGRGLLKQTSLDKVFAERFV